MGSHGCCPDMKRHAVRAAFFIVRWGYLPSSPRHGDVFLGPVLWCAGRIVLLEGVRMLPSLPWGWIYLPARRPSFISMIGVVKLLSFFLGSLS